MIVYHQSNEICLYSLVQTFFTLDNLITKLEMANIESHRLLLVYRTTQT